MVILGIETSCDETAAAVVEYQENQPAARLLSNVVASSIEFHQKYGGVVPEIAARQQLQSIIPVIHEALQIPNSRPSSRAQVGGFRIPNFIDAIAATVGPGLIGSLLVGVETAKALALAWNKPLVPVNHLLAHFYASWITPIHLPGVRRDSWEVKFGTPEFPSLGLLASGGHTDLILMKDHQSYQWLGGTKDDAAGEAFDKIARILGLGYPGGPKIAQVGQGGRPDSFAFPRPMIDQANLDFSFAGLKTSVLYTVRQLMNDPVFDSSQKPNLTLKQVADLAASAQEAIVDALIAKTKKALVKYQPKSLIVAGGVAANQRLRDKLSAWHQSEVVPEKRGKSAGKDQGRWQLFIPPPGLCTDNAAYVATRAALAYHPKPLEKVQANAGLRL